MSDITVVVPTSPIPSHPDTAILEETLDSIRHHLPDSEIILTFDGVREEQRAMRESYSAYTYKALWLADHKYGNVCPIVFSEHTHQVGMMRKALGEVRTPLLMYVEHDTPLTDAPIKFKFIEYLVLGGQADLVRLHHEAVIPEEHKPMILGTLEYNAGGELCSFIKTSQWSQRPHVASTAFYHRILQANFTPEANSFIEDKMHGVCDEAYKLFGDNGWQQHKLFIYQGAEGESLLHTYHADGRAGGPKYDDQQRF